MSSSKDIQKWYNDFSVKQLHTGVNLRHYKIMNYLQDYGLTRSSKVLEIGCGIGTLTGLIHNVVSNGKLVATDISDESIKVAKERLPKSENIDFVVTDMHDFSYKDKFDFIVLPDVLEHIPLNQHPQLFEKMAAHMHDKSVIVIHIPHPKGLDYIRKFKPEQLQIVDQSISAKDLMNNAYNAGLILIEYKSYTVFNDVPDYVLATFKKENDVTLTPLPKPTIIKRKLSARLRYYKHRYFG